MNFMEILQEANKTRAKEWDPQGNLDLIFKAFEICTEAGKLGDACKKLYRYQLGINGGNPDRAPIEEEIADVFICMGLLLLELNIPTSELHRIIRDKFNATSRKYNLATRMA